MRSLYIDNYVIDTPLIDIINRLRVTITNGKLKDVVSKTEYIMVTCPHHKDGREARPDCGIYIGEDQARTYGFAHCFACSWAVDFVTFVKECFESSEDYAKKWLISNYGKLAKNRISLGAPINIAKKVAIKTIDTEVLDDMASWCPYLAKRGISRATCTKFGVKYDAEKRQVVFPCYDEQGRFIIMAKRSVDTKFFHMDDGIEKPVYCLNNIIANNIKTAVITEGPFDCLSANEYGFPAIATLGTPSLDQIRKINASCISTLYLMFDNDDAGKKFTEFLKARLNKRILLIEVKIPFGKKDINDLSKDEFITAIKNARKNDKISLKISKI